ncbi:hypothetical protein [Accumulibacter sp.]|uniref:hypothetical protein n=1 Tax=Accumulibacter sp. TaxID=2053492 RepID=UPI0025EBA774|nr:hypothetical protein [Accumulibacter sp.]MCM8594228.1 hypothetical protein [Accumulibacter sp.]MCM8625794.1 hypothetical protein [Accumulibacter sp.]MDS4048371.1 hypothetical protein [Accumulibacter sp.]
MTAVDLQGAAHEAAALLARIDAWLAADLRSGPGDGGTSSASTLDLEGALHSQAWSNLTPEADAQLDRLRKKIEVARKLCRYYVSDLSRAAEPTPLAAAAVRRLCVLLLKAALVRDDARYLNSALKLLDGVLGRDDCSFPDELRQLARSTLDALVPPAPPST